MNAQIAEAARQIFVGTCKHEHTHTEMRTMPAVKYKYGYEPEYDYEAVVCNDCNQEVRVLADVNWDLLEDDLPL